ncbi:MAG TPA: class I SAM-dependent methyltransferase [Candidatus Polarisedimenticolaceae bacterium]|nr:class I SAM-dependent methyltransferase [Candidatus Polarisedimenticolaceae bacterium]
MPDPVESRDPGRVRAMFGGIARRYDLLNHVLSLNLDRGWRARAAREACVEPVERVLDLCGGTGDLTLALARAADSPSVVVCCDFSRPMLARAAAKFRSRGVADRCVTIEGDALRLPFADGTFGAITVGFGIRNLADMGAGLREALRVLAPGGRLVVLEFSRPRGPVLSRLHGLYLERVVPLLGDGAAGRTGPYRYLARTIGSFPEPDVLAGTIREAGFAAVGWQALSGGIVCLHTAFKEPSPRSPGP